MGLGGGGGGEFPSEDITILHPYGAASSPAAASLMVQERNQEQDIFPVDIRTEEKTGGGGIVGYNAAYNAEPDGYTLCDSVGPSMLLKPLVSDEATYDPTEFSYVGNGQADYECMAVPADSDIETGKDAIDALKDGSQFSAVSNTSSLTVLLHALGDVGDFYDPAIVMDRFVSFPPGETAPAAIRGDVELTGLNLSVVNDFIENGDLKVPLFFHTEDNLPERAREIAPEADTLDSIGLTSDEASTVEGMYPSGVRIAWFGPPGIEEERRQTLEDGFKEAVDNEDWAQELENNNLGYPNWMTGEEINEAFTETWEEWQSRDELTSLMSG
ncbi:Bug family tripartite tricarboxylate transporter substrate binding protein [Halobacteriales archaeon Cl-PHB]